MKRILTSALILTLSFTVAQGQNKGNHKGGKHHNMEQKMDYEKLNLSAEQKTQLKAVHADFKKQHEELKNNTALSKELKKTRMQELKEAHKKAIKDILTAEQEEALAKQRTEMSGKSRKGKFEGKVNHNHRDTASYRNKKGGKGLNQGDDMRKDLNLSAEQKIKIKKIRTQYKNKMDALRNDNSLTADQKKARLMELRKAQNEEIKALLTPEQIEKMKGGRKERALNTK